MMQTLTNNDELADQELSELTLTTSNDEENEHEENNNITINTDTDSNNDFSILHPLQNNWTMWYDTQQSSSTWIDNLISIHTFATVEDFWRLFNSLALPSILPIGSNYHLFKTGIKPMWEDIDNSKGGKWTVQITRSNAGIDDYWLYSLLALIGEELDTEDEITGAVINVRSKIYKISIWTKHSDRLDIIQSIGIKFKAALSLEPSDKIDYTAHDSSYSKAPYRQRGY